MRGQLPSIRSPAALHLRLSPHAASRQCRAIQISASPSTGAPGRGGDAFSVAGSGRDTADARFEVLGSPYSLLSVTLSASQRLYTRRGTLTAVAGQAEHAQSTLSVLSPFTRAFFGVPFLYQRITSTTPITALISTKSPNTTFAVVHLDGTTDWMVAQRNALLAWTGHTLNVSPRLQTGLSLAHWGNTHLSGRGLVGLSAPGQIYEVTLDEGEEFVAHPSSVVAYSLSRNPPLPFRFKSSSLRLQIPSVTSWLANIKFIQVMRSTSTYKTLANILFRLRTSMRRTIWGDRLFLQFRGPTTLLMSSRGVRIMDSLTNEDLNEIADSPAGSAPKAVDLAAQPKQAIGQQQSGSGETAIHVATVTRGGKVTFEDSKDLKQFLN